MKWQYFPSVGIKATLQQWDMSHYDLVLDLAKMLNGRSRLRAASLSLCLCLCLLLCSQSTVSMSLDRLALERNELNAAENEAEAATESAILVDDMKMAPMQSNGQTDMYMLLPASVASQLDDAEHVQQNTIETEPAAQPESSAPGESADMLMLESDDTPAMQLVELPSDITVAELMPEPIAEAPAEPEVPQEMQAEVEAAAETAAAVEAEAEAATETVVMVPEVIEEHVVEQPQAISSQEAQLEHADVIMETVTEAAPAAAAAEQQVLADDEMPAQDAEPQTDSKSETEPEPVVEAEMEAEPVAALEAESELESEPVAEVAVQPESEPEPELVAQVVADEAAEPVAEVETQTESLSKLETEPEAVPEAETLAEAETIAEAETLAEAEAETMAEAEAESMSGVVATDATEATMLETLATGIEQGLNEVMSELNEQVMVAATEVNNVEEPAAAANEPEPEQVTEQPVEIVDPVEPVVDSTENETERAIEEQTMEKVEPVEPVAVAEAEPEPIAIETMEKVEQEEPAEPIVTVEQLPMEPKPVEQSMLTTIIPAVEPVQVLDSVLNYVNASFMPAEQDLPKVEPEVELETSQLRRYDGAQLWRIVVQTDKDKKLADELQSKYDGQLWKEVKQEVDYLLKPQVLAAAERHIRSANLSRIVLIDNLQQVIEVENPPAEKIAELQNRKGHRLTWQAYHRLEDIHGFIDYMAKTYPDICTAETIGYSVEKRPLKILKISNGNPNNPGIWMDGGMHAREWISPATVTYVANQLVEGWEDLPEHMRNINWYIHPVANPDGYEYSHTTDRLWRKNMRAHGRQCPGVDLNRNFGYKWGGKGTSASPCSQTYRGSKAFSEPETFYISKFISGFPRDTFQAYLSFHSYGQYILYPWGYDYQLTKDRADLDRVARQAGSIITKSSGVKYTVGSAATTLYPAAGGSDDWAKGIAGIKYAYTIEMGDTGRYGFVLPAQFIQYNGKDGYTFADTVARAIAQGHNTEARSKSNRRRLR